MKQARKNLIPIICLALTFLILVGQVQAEPSKLFVRDVEFNSNLIKIGEEANIKMNIKNLSKNRECCNVTIFCGGKKLKQEEITIEPQSSVPLHHSFNTSGMSTGTYSIETIIESTGDQKMFDLGEFNLVEDLLSSEPVLTNLVTIGSLDSLVPLLLIPIGIISSIIIITQHKTKKSEVPEEELGIEEIPKLLGGIFNMQEQQVTNNEENENIQGKKGYIC